MKLSIIIPIIEPTENVLYSLNSAIECFIKNCEKEIILVSDTQFDPKTFDCYNDLKDNWKFIINKKPIGIFESRRKGLKKSTGDLVWFFDSTDRFNIFELSEKLLDYDVSVFDLNTFKESDTSNYSYTYSYDNYGNADDEDYKKLNPFSTRHLLKKYLNPFIGNFIFKAEFIKFVYEKIPTINDFNRYSNLYLIAAALKYMKSFKYYKYYICSIKIKDNYTDEDDLKLYKNHAIYNIIYPSHYFDDSSVERFKTILENDEVKISKEIVDFINSFKSINNEEKNVE